MEKKDHTQVHSNLFSSARWHYLNAIIRNRLFTYLEECAIFKLLNKVSILLIIWFLKCSACSIQSTATGSVESFDVAGATSPTGGTFIDFTWRQAKVAPNLKFISTFFPDSAASHFRQLSEQTALDAKLTASSPVVCGNFVTAQFPRRNSPKIEGA